MCDSNLPDSLQLTDYTMLQVAAYVEQLKVIDNDGDGDCQFLAVSHQLQVHHGRDVDAATLRKMAVQHHRDNPYIVSLVRLNRFSISLKYLLKVCLWPPQSFL